MDRKRRESVFVSTAAMAVLLPLLAIPAQAQTRTGSYLDSCTDVHIYADRLLADCRQADGRWTRSALLDLGHCVGAVLNIDGKLACLYGERSYGAARSRDLHPGEGYGSSIDRRLPRGSNEISGAGR